MILIINVWLWKLDEFCRNYPLASIWCSVCVCVCVLQIKYYLDEENHWALDMKELQRSIDEARASDTCFPRAIVVINPGNPTGECYVFLMHRWSGLSVFFHIDHPFLYISHFCYSFFFACISEPESVKQL